MAGTLAAINPKSFSSKRRSAGISPSTRRQTEFFLRSPAARTGKRATIPLTNGALFFLFPPKCYDHSMFRRAASLLLIASLLGSMGAHLGVIQTMAWAKMAVSFAKNNTLSVSLQKTFDGQHPCALCLQVKKLSQSNASFGTARTENRLDAVAPTILLPIRSINTIWTLTTMARFGYDHFISLDSPPPKEILS